MDRETQIKLVKAGRTDLLDIALINESGYAGITRNGNIVDRRSYPAAVPVPENRLLDIPPSKDLPELRPFDIWMEGFIVTGQSGQASKINKDPIIARTFNDAVRTYMGMNPESGIELNTPARYVSPEAYLDRKSSYNIWGCNLFDNEADARKAFG